MEDMNIYREAEQILGIGTVVYIQKYWIYAEALEDWVIQINKKRLTVLEKGHLSSSLAERL